MAAGAWRARAPWRGVPGPGGAAAIWYHPSWDRLAAVAEERGHGRREDRSATAGRDDARRVREGSLSGRPPTLAARAAGTGTAARPPDARRLAGPAPTLGRRAFLGLALAALATGVRRAAGAVEPRRGAITARASLLYGILRVEESGMVEAAVDPAGGRYEVRVRAQGADLATELDSAGVLREGRWAPTRFQDRFVVHGRESRLEIGYDHDRRRIEFHGRSETFFLRRTRAVDDVVPMPPGLHVDDVISAILNYADGRWPPEPDGTFLTRVVRRRRGPREGPDDVDRTYRAELVPFALRVTDEGGRPTATFDMTRFSSWARADEPGRIVFTRDRRPETISASLILGTALTIRIEPGALS